MGTTDDQDPFGAALASLLPLASKDRLAACRVVVELAELAGDDFPRRSALVRAAVAAAPRFMPQSGRAGARAFRALLRCAEDSPALTSIAVRQGVRVVAGVDTPEDFEGGLLLMADLLDATWHDDELNWLVHQVWRREDMAAEGGEAHPKG